MGARRDSAPAAQVMGSPNSSYVWIQFMAHLVSLGQLDAARAVAERALGTIGFRWAARLVRRHGLVIG